MTKPCYLWLTACGCVLAAVIAEAKEPTQSKPGQVYWRFESGSADQPVAQVLDESGKHATVAAGSGLTFSSDVPFAIIPSTASANHQSLNFHGGHLRVMPEPDLDMGGNFTVEMWVKFTTLPSQPMVLMSKGEPASGNWHFILQNDGTLQANIYGESPVYLFGPAEGPPRPGVWYHIAASFERKDGGTIIRTYVNGQLHSRSRVKQISGTGGADLFIGSSANGQFPFRGLLDEVRITSGVLENSSMLIGGAKALDLREKELKPLFVRAGTPINDALRAKAKGAPILAKPEGYRYYFQYIFGAVKYNRLPEGYEPGFAYTRTGTYADSSPGYHFVVRPGGAYTVAVGFYDPDTPVGQRRQRVVIDGVEVDKLDPAAAGDHKPFVRIYEARDANHDGLLEVSCPNDIDEGKHYGILSTIWVFAGVKPSELESEKLARGISSVAPMYHIHAGQKESAPGHIDYPALSAVKRKQFSPMRRFNAREPDWPQPADPLDLEVRGDLAQRIYTYADRWGFAGRDQKLVCGFLSDCGFEVAGRNLETYYLLGRLMKRDYDLTPAFETLLLRQDAATKYPGSFIGGNPLRTGFIWGQGTILSGLAAYYEMTGDNRALASADKLAKWYLSYLDNGDLNAANYFAGEGKFKRDGATVGHLGKGALDGLVWLFMETKKPEYLEEAKRMAELNRQHGGVSWLIHGEEGGKQEYEGWHLHANLSTLRAFPWLYEITGDRSYLEDAKKGCDRTASRAMWGTGGVLEQIPWRGTKHPGATPDPHDEICQTADLLMLSWLIYDFTGEMKYYDLAESIYFNHIRYAQIHNGNFTAFNRLPGPQRGGDAWFCCGWWGGKALYEAARHVFASSRFAVYVNGYLPATGHFKVNDGEVRIDLAADVPVSGAVKASVEPKEAGKFALCFRVPSWARLDEVRVNARVQPPTVEHGYVKLDREWKRGDKVAIRFGLPLRVALDEAWDGLPPAKVRLNDQSATARCISIFRGPALLAQFRLAAGNDLNWAWSGDHPDLHDTLNSAPDLIEGPDWNFRSSKAPELTTIEQTDDGVRLNLELKPHEGWTLKRTAVVRSKLPVEVTYSAELIAPSPEAMSSLKSVQLCGVRMKAGGFEDYTPVRLRTRGKTRPLLETADQPLTGEVVLDNGYVQFHVASKQNKLIAMNDGSVAGIYAIPARDGIRMKASITLKVTGQSQFEKPLVR